LIENGETKLDATKIGFVFIIVGVFILALGTPMRLDWFIQSNYILNAPTAVLATFVAIGVFLIFASSRIKADSQPKLGDPKVLERRLNLNIEKVM
jgi:hypothetical protein